METDAEKVVRLVFLVLTILTCGVGAILWLIWEAVYAIANSGKPTAANVHSNMSVVPLPRGEAWNTGGPTNADADEGLENLTWEAQRT